MTVGVWDLKASLGCNLGPKDVLRHKLGTLAPIFTSRTLFSPESLHISHTRSVTMGFYNYMNHAVIIIF